MVQNEQHLVYSHLILFVFWHFVCLLMGHTCTLARYACVWGGGLHVTLHELLQAALTIHNGLRFNLFFLKVFSSQASSFFCARAPWHPPRLRSCLSGPAFADTTWRLRLVWQGLTRPTGSRRLPGMHYEVCFPRRIFSSSSSSSSSSSCSSSSNKSRSSRSSCSIQL